MIRHVTFLFNYVTRLKASKSFLIVAADNILRAELIEHARVGLHESDEIFRFENAKRPEVRASFRKTLQLVRAGER